MGILQQMQSAWSAFANRDADKYSNSAGGISYSGNSPYATGRTYRQNSITSPVFNRIALDVASVDFNHIIEDPKTGERTQQHDALQDRLNIEANIDQTGKAFIQDAVNSMFEEGVVALVPIYTDTNLFTMSSPGAFTINSWRVGRITKWSTLTVTVEVYNEETGLLQQMEMPKRAVAIIQNPLYPVMNARNSTLDRLVIAIQQMDSQDTSSIADKLNLLISLPYQVKNKTKEEQANGRLAAISEQLKNSPMGIGYIDTTEKVTQLNRPLNTNLSDKADALRKQFMNQLGLTEAVFDGTADEVQMKNYYSRTIDVIVNALILEITRVAISPTARTQGHKIIAYRDPFTLVATEKIADMAKTLIDARAVRPNEMRPKFGFDPIPPDEDPIASTLANPNVDTLDTANAVQQTNPGGEPQAQAADPNEEE